ncbi:hypothetical protein D3093_11900 [Azospirillum argentinense]|uniref:Uncharacterized protein n=1 Tax=Azospirillum argentinense TaxID=2970906 RepID=A0A4D8PBB6_9PROT|nr:hypothetical protein [Azospirillum argentinense]QCN95906.1 hypothetical protein D3093_11900 [Azospirillum argentinense]
MDRHTSHAAHHGTELFTELSRRIQGEAVDLGDMQIVLGHDSESGLPAMTVRSGTTLFALVLDNGELTELPRGSVGTSSPED